MSAATYTRYELVRTFRNRRFFIFSLVFPLVLYYLIAGPNRDEARHREHGHLRAALLHGRSCRVWSDDGDDRERRAHRGRAEPRLEPAAADHATLDQGLLQGEGADRLRDGGDLAARARSRGDDARRHPAGRRVGADDRP